VEQEARRHDLYAEALGQLAIAVAQDEQLRAASSEVAADTLVVAAVDAHRRDRETSSVQLALQLQIEVQRLLAGLAPRRPEIEEHHAATQVRERQCSAPELGERDAR